MFILKSICKCKFSIKYKLLVSYILVITIPVLIGSIIPFAFTQRDSTNKAINLITGKLYTTVGGELTAGDGKSKIASLNKSKIYIDGISVTLRFYTINGNSYFKLHDIAKVLNIGITWDGKTR